MARRWSEIRIDAPQEYGEALANYAIECGAPGVIMEDEDTRTIIVAHFAADAPVSQVELYCREIGCDPSKSDGARITSRTIDDESWADNWKSHFGPIAIGQRLAICPPWEPQADGRITIVINPGMAFGTGQHQTTRGCLLFIEDWCCRHRVRRVVDVGTGSGILAIALAKLGVEEVWAADTDESACLVARDNSVVNAVSERIHITSQLSQIAGEFDMVVANLFADALEAMANWLVSLLRPGGALICSGLLTADEERLHSAFRSRRLMLWRSHVDGEWVTLGFEAKAAV